MADVARKFVDMGFKLVATAGTADIIEEAGMSVERVYKVKEGRPNAVDLIKGDRIQLIVNTPHGVDPFFDEKAIRRAAVQGAHPDHHHSLRRPRRRRRHRRLAAWRSPSAGAAEIARGAEYALVYAIVISCARQPISAKSYRLLYQDQIMLLQGVFPPITTPFYPDSNVYYKKLEANVDRYSRTPVAGMLALGSTGEAVMLSDQERRDVLKDRAGCGRA